MSERTPTAWLKRWKGDLSGKLRQRVDMTPDCEPWLSRLNPEIIPLYPLEPANDTAKTNAEPK